MLTEKWKKYYFSNDLVGFFYERVFVEKAQEEYFENWKIQYRISRPYRKEEKSCEKRTKDSKSIYKLKFERKMHEISNNLRKKI